MKSLTVVTAILSLPLLTSPVSASVKNDLQGIRSEIKQKETLLKKTAKIEKAVTGELAEIDRNLRTKEQELVKLKKELDAAERKLTATTAETDRAKGEVAAKQEEIRKRLAAMYKSGDPGTLGVMFSSESLPAMHENTRYMRAVVENDRQLVGQYRAKMQRLTQLSAQLEDEAAKKERIRQGVEQKKGEIEGEKKKKVSYLGKVREDRKSYEASLRELEANARRLQAMVQKLDALSRRSYTRKPETDKRTPAVKEVPYTPYEGKGLSGGGGSLAFPARGKVIGTFGKHKHAEFNSYTVSNGITIEAPAGTEFRAVSGGKVIFADYFKGYGNMIILDHGDGFFSLYAHASRLLKKEGAVVSKSDVLGAVGDVDSSKGPVLYFELRRQGKPVDPGLWFR
ncbi:MAG TPA: peptidoglycan DD-metalloendopeptidase family protein [Verrucomicrobiae bacterium]|nr:peptidoglycan DD-metalloendopeptidase family protein [Verrucomicrobiae bacterium]